ncbi:hypothetical protein RchiOBHm_Chr6g0283931 [Rosa chinensis]|uniref:Uncharacterized protein n=1 Tax=Rosa chinensis TaxID=74649 RepID=A0A2P6PU60_ROSCH|nr:hypothetical protein RchiOBHm_Chr6g0283931 [Rosa chinensis]
MDFDSEIGCCELPVRHFVLKYISLSTCLEILGRVWRPSPGSFEGLLEFSKSSDACLEPELSQWKVQALTALKVGEVELRSMFLKGGGILTLAKIYQLLARKLFGKVFLEASNYHECLTT